MSELFLNIAFLDETELFTYHGDTYMAPSNCAELDYQEWLLEDSDMNPEPQDESPEEFWRDPCWGNADF